MIWPTSWRIKNVVSKKKYVVDKWTIIRWNEGELDNRRTIKDFL